MTHPKILLFLIVITPLAQCAIPGLFFWRPHLGIDLSVPTTEVNVIVQKPTSDNLRSGLVVLVDGYQAGLTVIALAAGLSSGSVYPHLSLVSAYFYTNVYRWALRYFSLIPFWMGGHGGNLVETHKTWRRRFYYMDQFMPKWMRYLFPFVKQEEWEKEEKEMVRFKKYAEPAFGKHYRFPSKIFRKFLSEMTKPTDEEMMKDSNISPDR